MCGSLVVLTALFVTCATGGQALAHPPDKWPGQVPCHFHWWNGPHAVAKLITCAAQKFDVSVHTSLRVANCESGFNASAGSNPPYAGVYQHHRGYWPGRVDAYWFGKPENPSPFHGRANVFVTMRMVNDVGWGPWSCY